MPPSTQATPPAPADPAPPGRFAPAELEAVLKRYDLGRIDSIRELLRGSPHAPKAVVAGPEGRFLIKRRAPGEDHPYHVAFCHALQLHLADRAFPAPALIGTRDDNNSMLQLDGRVYEATEFVEGDPFDRSPGSARAAGAMLARFHAGARGFQSSFHTPPDFAHGDERAEILIDRCIDRFGSGSAAPTAPPAINPGALLDQIRTLWRRAVADLDHAGIAAWPRDLLHADWHPGNLVFTTQGPSQSIRAVLDYDSCRRGPRLFDVAAGALNFSIIGGEPAPAATPTTPDPTRWPAPPDESRARAFLAGYQADQPRLSAPERATLAPAMAAAMILESLPPIATTGSFASIPGLPFLDMVARKSAWLLDNRDAVAAFASA